MFPRSGLLVFEIYKFSWLEQISHFDLKMELFVVSEMKPTDYFSCHLLLKADMDTQIDEQFFINELIPFCEWSQRIRTPTLNEVYIRNDATTISENRSHRAANSVTVKTQAVIQIETSFRQKQSAHITTIVNSRW